MREPSSSISLCLLLFGLRLTLVSANSTPETLSNSTQVDVGVDLDASHSEPNTTPKPSLVLGPISKSPLDRRAYRAVLLSNGLKVILVSDPNTTKAAASLSISVGSIDDPPLLEGLAHFLEHMLFLGNAKYPQENGFQKYIAEHGGSSNAVTQPDKTYYFFRVSPAGLQESLERFAALFISPLFTASALQREALAVDSEHQKYIPDDRRRLERIEASTGSPGHPFTQYRTGTIDTLINRPTAAGINVSASLVHFHQTHYCADKMALALISSESLDQLQSIVERFFLSIPNRLGEQDNGTHSNWTAPGMEPLYGEEELGERLDIVPVGNFRSLQLIFPVPPVKHYYKNTGLGYISHLMGQEGPGSLSALLKKKHWAESVTVGGYLPTQGLTFFKVKIALTQEGLGNVDPIVKLIFQYIEMMREEGPQSWFWEEVRDINLIHFRFRDEAYPMDLVTKLSVNMINYPVEKVLHVSGIDEDLQFDPSTINQTLTFLTPLNCRLFVTSTEFENRTLLREEYFGVAYNRRKLEPVLIQEWNSVERRPEFHLPPKNEFVPSKFDLKDRDNFSLDDPLTPRKLIDSNLSQLWYLQDNSFLLPKATVTVELLTPLAYEDPIKSNLLFLWSTLITESLGEFQYSATLAGLESEIIPMEGGLLLTVKGYDHKLVQFVRKIFLRILTLARIGPDPEVFATSKDSLRQILLNSDQAQPYDLANTLLRRILLERRWSPVEALETVLYPNYKDLSQKFLSRLKFRWLFYGNLTPQECLTLVSESEALFTSNGTRALFPSQRAWSRMRVVELPPGSNLLFRWTTPSHSSSCTVFIFQIGLDSTRNTLLVSLLARASHPFLFDRLRTQEALGYAVWADVYSDKFGVSLSFRIVVQGSGSPSFVEARITHFLAEFEQLLGNMTEKEFGRHRKSLANLKSSPPKTMGEKLGSLHREIVSGRGHFHRQVVEVAALEGITLADLREFYKEKVINPNTRRKLAVYIQPSTNSTLVARNAELENATFSNSSEKFSSSVVVEEIVDVTTWKETMQLFPSLNPYYKAS